MDVVTVMATPLPLQPFPWIDAMLVLALIVLNGVFAMSELAIVSARRARLEAMARAGSKGAHAAMALSADPGRLLSTVQIGITSISLLAGAFSGERLGAPIGERLTWLGISAEHAANAGFAIAMVLTTYASLIVGELVPKQFALRNPEPIAAFMARPLAALARWTAPLGWLLDRSSALIFRLLRMNRESEQHVTAEELHLIVAEASKSGVIEESERAIISGVVRLADRPVREVMTPRREVDWIDVDADAEAIRARLLDTPHSRLVVAEGSVENIVGVVQARDIMTALVRGEPLDIRALMRKVEVVPDQVDAMDALERLREADVPMVMVHDEYGHFEGVVTPADLLSAIAGDFASDQDLYDEPMVAERDDGSLLVAGQMPIDQLAGRLGLELDTDRDYATVAGHALAVLKHLPDLGEHFDDQGWRFEIIDLDGRKIDKLLVSKL